MWVIRAGRRSIAHQIFLDGKVVALASQNFGDLSSMSADLPSFKRQAAEMRVEQVERHAPDGSPSVFFRFVRELRVGDIVFYPSTALDRMIHVGIITGVYVFVASDREFPHQRSVEWIGEMPRDSLGKPLAKEVSYFFPFYKIKRHRESFLVAVASLRT